MGTYTFKWPHPAQEVFVTGTFDNWGKTVQLQQNGSVFEKTVTLPPTEEKVLYKFVADGQWLYDHTGQTEADHEGNLNNVLYPHDLQPSEPSSSFISSVAPGSSTLAMASEQPLIAAEKDTPGAFPVTPAAVEDAQTFSVNPIPKSEGIGNPISLAPGEKVPEPSTFNSNTIESTVETGSTQPSAAADKEMAFGVAPIPASGGIGNPITLAPGEPVPEHSAVTGHTLASNITSDEASYNSPDSVLPVLPGNHAPTATSTANEAAIGGAVLGGLGPQTSNFIPESSMGMGDGASIEPTPFLASTGAGSTTAALAGEVPLEPRGVPEIVSESQQEAHVEPEASANSEAVKEKSEVEQELQSKISEAPVTSDDTHKENSKKTEGISAAIAGGAAAVTGVAIGAAVIAREKTTAATGKDPVELLPESVQKKVEEATPKPTAAPITAPNDTVPAEVVESQQIAHVSAEASANPAAVHEKSLVESELLSKVPEVETAGEPAPTVTAATSAVAPAEKTSSGAPQLAPVTAAAPISLDAGLNSSADSPAVPETSKAAPVAPEAAATSATTASPLVATGVGAITDTPPATARPKTTDTSSKRRSFMMGSSDSAKGEKKGLFSRIKEKLKSHK